MKIERTKNAARNMIFGWLAKFYQLFVPFLLRTAMIHYMGVQYLGLSSLFTSVLSVLNLAELGVGSAMIFSMYKPIAEDDTDTICALMKLYRTYYRIIGLVIAAAGAILTPFIPYLISGDVPSDVNVYVLYLLNLSTTVLSYWLFAYKSSILKAHQRNDISSKIELVTSTFVYILQFFALSLLHSYYVYIMISLGSQAVGNILNAVAADRMYPDYRPRGELPPDVVKGIHRRVKDLFTAKVGGTVINSVDTLVISAFLGLSALAIYQNYYYIMTAILGMVSIIFGACTAGVGNSMIVETKEKNFTDFKKFTFLIAWIAGFCTCCLLCLFQPFMDVWVGEDLQMSFPAVICLCAYYFVYEMNQILCTYKDAGGIWHKDRFRPLVTTAVNLTLNLTLVRYWGLYAIILSTVISLIGVATPWLLYNVFTELFDLDQLKIYLKRWVLYYLVVACNCGITYFVCSLVSLSKWATLFVRAGICCVVPNLFFYAVYRKMPEFRQCLTLLDRMTRNKLKLEEHLAPKS